MEWMWTRARTFAQLRNTIKDLLLIHPLVFLLLLYLRIHFSFTNSMLQSIDQMHHGIHSIGLICRIQSIIT